MTKEEAVKEIEKAFEPAFANYIITALTEDATVSDIQHRWGRAYEAGVKDGLEQESCEDAVSRDDVVRIVQHNNPLKALEKIRKLSSVTPQEQMVEIDLYSVIKQKYIEREVLDNIRAEIWDLQYGDEEKSMTDEDRADVYNNAIRQVIEIIDKYKSESEGKQ